MYDSYCSKPGHALTPWSRLSLRKRGMPTGESENVVKAVLFPNNAFHIKKKIEKVWIEC